jgi:hypothetical protein
LSINDDESEEIITYNQLLEYLSRDKENDIVWKFQRIVSHQGPLKPTHPDYNGSSYNVLVEWENGETNKEPLQVIAKDNPVTCVIYAKDHGLLNETGWKQFKAIAKRQKNFTSMVNQANLRSFKNSTKFKYGFEAPKSYEQAVQLDEANRNKKLQEATEVELASIDAFSLTKGITLKQRLQRATRKSVSTSYLTLIMMGDTKHGW